MSLIADALRKAGSSPDPDPVPSESPRKPLWPYRAALLGLTAMVLVGLGLLKRQADRPLPPTAGLTAPAAAKAPQPLGIQLLRQAEGSLSLSGIVRAGEGKSLAVINGRVLEEGDTVGAVRLVRVESDQVQVEENGTVRTLKLGN